MADEYKDGWVNFEWLKELAEKADRMGKIDRQKSQEEMLKANADEMATAFRAYYNSFCEAGFSDDQAFDLLMTMVGRVTGN